MKRINWKLIFKLIITIATAILGMLNSQEKLPYNENWRASREDHWTGRIEQWNVRLRLVTNVLLLLAAIVAILSCSRILWRVVLQQSKFKHRPEIMQSQPATVGFAFGWCINDLLVLQRGLNRAIKPIRHIICSENYLLGQSIIFRFVTDISYVFLGFVWVNAYFCAQNSKLQYIS